MGIVYLLQPQEFINTNILKIGHSTKNNLSRCKSYGSNSIIYNVRTFNNSSYVEKVLLCCFNKRFKLYKGNEYFEGDLKEMDNLFYFLVTNDDVIRNGNCYNEIYANNFNDTIDIKRDHNVKNKKEYVCSPCSFQTNKKSNFDYHMNCKKHINRLKDSQKNNKYICCYCNYSTDIKASYYTHLLTNKHKKIELEYNEKNSCKKELKNDTETETNIEPETETNITTNDNYSLQINNLNTQVSYLTNLVESLIKEKKDEIL